MTTSPNFVAQVFPVLEAVCLPEMGQHVAGAVADAYLTACGRGSEFAQCFVCLKRFGHHRRRRPVLALLTEILSTQRRAVSLICRGCASDPSWSENLRAALRRDFGEHAADRVLSSTEGSA